jgi:predicted transcriptional regulator of viral defense system
VLQIVGRYEYMPTIRNKSPRIDNSSQAVSQVLILARKQGILRARDLDGISIPREYLTRLVRRGQLERVERGLYRIPGAEVGEHHTLAQVAKRIPRAVVCLLSALRFHNLTTQSPAQVWIAIDRKARRPVVSDLPLRVVRFSRPALTVGSKTYALEGVPVQITTPAKTVADSFKYRNKIGLDVALEALREGWRERRFDLDELWEMARVCRVTNVIRPYLESIV